MQAYTSHSNLSSAAAQWRQTCARIAAVHAAQQRAMCESLARMQALWLQPMQDLARMQRALYGYSPESRAPSATAYLDPLLDFDEAEELRLTALYWDKL